LSPTAHKKPPAAACNNRFDEVEPEFVPWVKLFQLMIAFVTSRVVEVEKYSVAKAQIVREGHVSLLMHIHLWRNAEWSFLISATSSFT
jgi:hypothetical protein